MVDQQQKDKYNNWWNEWCRKGEKGLNTGVEFLLRRWEDGKIDCERQYSSGQGISLVAFLKSGNLYRNIIRIQEGLLSTSAAKTEKIVLNPPSRLHLTIHGLNTGPTRISQALTTYHSQHIADSGKTYDEWASSLAEEEKKKIIAQGRNDIGEEYEVMLESIKRSLVRFKEESGVRNIKLTYENDISVSQNARINILGFIEEGLSCLRETVADETQKAMESHTRSTNLPRPIAKGEHITIAAFKDRLSVWEFNEVKSQIESLRQEFVNIPLGEFKIHEVTLIHHYDDLLEQTLREENLSVF